MNDSTSLPSTLHLRLSQEDVLILRYALISLVEDSVNTASLNCCEIRHVEHQREQLIEYLGFHDYYDAEISRTEAALPNLSVCELLSRLYQNFSQEDAGNHQMLKEIRAVFEPF